MSPRSIHGRLLVFLIGFVAIVWCVTALISWVDARHELDELFDSHLEQSAALLAAGQIDPERVGELTHQGWLSPRVVFQIFHEGQLAVRSPEAPTQPLGEVGRGGERTVSTVSVGGHDWRVVRASAGDPDHVIFVGERLDSRAAILWAMLRSTLWPLAAALPLLALGIWRIVSTKLEPLRDVGAQLAARSPDQLDAVALHDVPNEMRPMLDALNRLFGRIKSMLESERHFTAEAAHELRTPIAAIRTQAQVALEASDDGVRGRALRQTIEGCDRATHLVNQLLTLARIESGAVPAMERFNLAAQVKSTVGEIATAALRRDQDLAVDIDTAMDTVVLGSPVLASVLIRNLVDNAMRYSADSARIRVVVRPAGDAVILTIEDEGPGLADTQLQRLGERFFRVPGSAESGSGLGWSIVRRIADLYGASITIGRSVELSGLAVSVTWPKAMVRNGAVRNP